MEGAAAAAAIQCRCRGANVWRPVARNGTAGARDLRFARGADALQENGRGLVCRILGDEATLERALEDGLAKGGGLNIDACLHSSPGKSAGFP